LRSQGIGGHRSHDHVDFETHEIGCEVGEAVQLTLGKSILDGDVLSLDPSEVAKTLPERLFRRHGGSARKRREKSDPRNLCRLLRVGHERPGNEARSERDE
jgi:hypothetical protein